MSDELHLNPIPLESRPGILFIGSSNVGKRSLLSRLLTVDLEDALDSPSQVLIHGWTINTQYYTADVSISVAHLHEQFSMEALPTFNQLAALVMVFDTSDLSSLVTLQDWVAHADLQKFDVLLCIGNKVDLVPGHPVHTEYRKLLQKQRLKDSSIDYSDTTEYGISEIEGSSLLGDEEPSWETRRSCLEWCTERNIEFIEACASNADFDKCLSIDGDIQGIQRLYGALSAHMWPGMILKSGDKITKPSLPKEELSEEESDFEIDYEILSGGSAELWDDIEYKGCSSNGEGSSIDAGTRQKDVDNAVKDRASQNIHEQPEAEENSVATNGEVRTRQKDVDNAVKDRASQNIHEQPEAEENSVATNGEVDQVMDPDEGKQLDLEDLERLMSEIGNMRDSLRLMPDFQRREMAAKLALKMAAMFGGSSDDEEETQ